MDNLSPGSNTRPSKVIMLGDSAVGKTSIVLQFYKGEFESMSEPTIGAAYVTGDVHTKKGPISMHIWDTAGQERFKSVIPMYTRGCAAAILVCAADSRESVLALDNWLKVIQEAIANPQNIYVALNKIDIDAVFDPAVPEKWASDHGFKFFRTSAKEKATVDVLFQEVGESLAAGLHPADLHAMPPPAKESKGCCG
jgi:small GTP-binding protein